MKYVYQTQFGSGGDCFRACIASILEKPIEEVPHFLASSTSGKFWTQEEWDETRDWHKGHGYRINWLDPDDTEDATKWIPHLYESGLHYIANVKSVYGGHSVVGHGGELVFCPNRGDASKYGEPYCYFVIEPIIPDYEYPQRVS